MDAFKRQIQVIRKFQKNFLCTKFVFKPFFVLGFLLMGAINCYCLNNGSNSFKNIKDNGQELYRLNQKGNSIGRNKTDSSKVFLEIRNLKFDRTDSTVEIEAYVFLIFGVTHSDTIGLRGFEVFTATPINNGLKNKKLVIINCEAGRHTNGFICKIKFRPGERLYITNCTKDLLKEWDIESLLNQIACK